MKMVYFDVPGFRPQDEYFHLAPGSQRSLRLIPQAPDARPALHGHVHALNAWSATAIEVDA